MPITRRTALGAAAASTMLPGLSRHAAAQDMPIRLGVLNDQSGNYRDDTGPLSVICVRQAVEEFAKLHPEIRVEVLSADHQNKPDIGAGIARRWFDEGGVDAILDVPTSSVALAVNTVCRERNKVFLNSGAATTDLTGTQCSPNTVHWTYDTYMLAKSTGGAMVKSGGDSWFFVTADYVFGQQLQRDTARFVQEAGGNVLGSRTYPFPDTTDFSSLLLQAQSSGAKVLGLCNSGTDTVNCIKQAHEFGLTKSMKIAAMLMYDGNVRSVGLEDSQGLVMTESFYWDLNDRTRMFWERIRQKSSTQPPNMIQAGCYAATLHYLKTAASLGQVATKADGRGAVAHMKSMPTDDDCFGAGRIREDGRKLHPSYLMQVKTPAESTGAFDVLKMVATTPPDEAFRPMSEGACSLVKS